METHDVGALAALAKAHGIPTIIDNSWASPVFQRPLSLGVDLVVHSASKYLGGHSDVVAGVVAGSKRADRPHPRRGLSLSRRQAVAVRRLAADPRPAHAADPHAGASGVRPRNRAAPAGPSDRREGLPSRPRQPAARRAHRHVGPVLLRVPRRHRHPRASPTACSCSSSACRWGGHESLIVPGEVVLQQKAQPNSAMAFGVHPRSVRLHVGLEGTEALWSDLEAAIAAASPTKRPEATRRGRERTMKKLLIAAFATRADVGHRTRRHHAEARGGDHQPGAHRDAEVDRRQVRGRQSRHQGRDHLAALGRGVPEIRDHGVGRRTARRGGDAGHLAVALCQQRPAREPRALSRQMGAHRGPDRPRAGARPRRQEHRLHAALRLLSARDVLQQEAVPGGRRRRAAEDHGRVRGGVRRRSPSCRANTATACAAARAASTAG